MKALRLLLFTFFLARLSQSLLAADPDYLPYDKFITAVEAGSVKSAVLDQFSEISGVYTVDGEERAFRSYGATGSANDVLLNRLLKQKNVAITTKDRKERSGFFEENIFGGFVLFVAPILTLILAFRINSKLNRLSKLNASTLH